MARKSLSKTDGPVALTGSVDFLPGSNILLIDKEGQPGAKPTMPLQRQLVNIPIVYWGAHNNYPMQVLEWAIQSPELLSLLEFLATVIYGDGIGYETYDKMAKKYVEAYDDEVQTWLTANKIDDFLIAKIIDLVWFNHGFTEMILSKDRKNICQIAHQEACFCRFGTQNPATGYNDKIYINANWPAGQVGDDWTTEVPAVNVLDVNAVDTLFNSAAYKVMYPTSFPFPGKMVYQLPGWHSLFPSKWFNISLLIPILKHALMQFQMTIKYVMEVPEEFWVLQAKDRGQIWETMTPAEKTTLKKLVKKEMDKFLTGAENTGKTLMTTFGWDKINKVKIPGVSITVLDDKLQDGKYIMDSKEASGQFARAVGIPLPLQGPISAGDMGAGSGSDARIHWNILNNRLKSRKQKAVSDLNFIAQYNGWTTRMPGFRFVLKSSVMDTLDVNHSTSNPAQAQQAEETTEPKQAA